MKLTSFNRNVAAAAAVMGSLTLLPATEAAVLYEIDFLNDESPTTNWTPLVNEAGWTLEDVGYRYRRATGLGETAPGVSSYTGIIGGESSSSLEHYKVESYFTKTSTASGNFTGVVARLQDAANYYTAVLNGAGTLNLMRVVDGVESNIASVTTPVDQRFAANETWRISLSVTGNFLQAYLYDSNDVQAGYASGIDNNFTSGTFGLRVNTSVNHHGAFETLTVTELDFEPPEPLLIANPPSGHIFDLGEFDPGEFIILPGEITLSNDGTGIIQRSGFQQTGSGLFDIQGLIREGTTIGEGQSHSYDIAFFGSEVLGVYEAFVTFQTTEGDIEYTLRATVVPEPAALSLVGLAGIGLLGRRVRRHG